MFKLDVIAKKFRLSRWVSQDALFRRINDNKGLSILCTEVINFGTHGITRPDSVLFALGSTIVNALFIFVVIPLRLKARKEKIEVLHIAA